MAHSGIVALGIFLLVFGLVASFYYESKTIYGIEYQRIYPYQGVGIALIVGGVLLVGFGALYSTQKKLAQSPSAQPIYNCPTCGQPLHWIQQYQRWYCDHEHKYV